MGEEIDWLSREGARERLGEEEFAQKGVTPGMT